MVTASQDFTARIWNAQTGQPIGTEIESAKLTAELHERLNDLVMRKVPVDRWPEDVREAAGEFLSTFSETED